MSVGAIPLNPHFQPVGQVTGSLHKVGNQLFKGWQKWSCNVHHLSQQGCFRISIPQQGSSKEIVYSRVVLWKKMVLSGSGTIRECDFVGVGVV